MTEITDLPVFQNLSNSFVEKIKSVYVFGRSGDHVILITIDDNVYSFGDNISGCLGVGHKIRVQKPTIIEELCQKRVINIYFGAIYDFVLAITENNTVYSWGNNNSGELGIGNTITQYKPHVINDLCDKRVIDINTGVCHSIALTHFGELYMWGQSFGCSPKKIEFKEKTQKIVSIASGLYHALALTDNGEVYCWGYNGYGQLGNNCYNAIIDYWCETIFSGEIKVSKIACGPYHSMILSTDGTVYCFGSNDFGQCGDGSNESRNIPIKINTCAKFTEISAINSCNISVGLSVKGICYVWGECGDQPLNSPIRTPFDNISDCIEFCSKIKLMFKRKSFANSLVYNSLMMQRIREKFNKREYSDIAFKIDSKYIYAQKSHLINVCKYFELMFSGNNWIESNKNEIEINQYSYAIFYAFIKYLYTESVEITAEEAIDLLDSANYYLEEELKLRCVYLIKQLLTNDNVFDIYYTAVNYNSRELKNYCIKYYLNNNVKHVSNIETLFEVAIKLFSI